MAKIDLKDFSETKTSAVLEIVRLDENETIIIPFTSEGESVNVHYCKEQDLNGYIHCNGKDCLLCKIGRKKDGRLLLPVYSATRGEVEILPIPPTKTPYSLLPQILPILECKKIQVVFITRSYNKYSVTHENIKKGIDEGKRAIKNFTKRQSSGEIDIRSIYTQIPNEILAETPEISLHMRIKGIKIDSN